MGYRGRPPGKHWEDLELKRRLLPLALLVVAACEASTPPAAEDKAARMLSGCGETTRLLGQMKAAESSFRYDEDGNATISGSLWAGLPDRIKDGLIKAVAYHAVCADNRLREQEVTIRSAETSEVLVRETVTEFDG